MNERKYGRKYGLEDVVGPSITSENMVTPEMRESARKYVIKNSTSDEDRDTLLSMLGLNDHVTNTIESDN